MNINLKQTYTCSRTLRTASLDVMTTLTIQRDENNKSQKKTKIISYRSYSNEDILVLVYNIDCNDIGIIDDNLMSIKSPSTFIYVL
jgi:cytidylate kinase